MPQEHSRPALDPIVAAMEMVLEAERESERKLVDCRCKTDAIIAAAHERAAEIARRANARISRIHAAYLQKIEAEIGGLSQAAAADPARHDEAALIGAVRRLAAKMTSDAGA